MYRFMLVTITASLLLAAAAGICAESLYQAEEAKSQFADKKAAKVGDILTIIIVESAASTSSAATDAKKDSKLETGPGVGPLLESIPLFKYSGGDSMKASGSTTRSNKLTAKMTAVVRKVDENGNLEIEGSRFVQTNKEKAEIKLTGLVRPQDVASDNTVLSTYLADAKITYVGSGPVGSRQKEGLISRIFRILF